MRKQSSDLCGARASVACTTAAEAPSCKGRCLSSSNLRGARVEPCSAHASTAVNEQLPLVWSQDGHPCTADSRALVDV